MKKANQIMTQFKLYMRGIKAMGHVCNYNCTAGCKKYSSGHLGKIDFPLA